jgi:hypothetical protein
MGAIAAEKAKEYMLSFIDKHVSYDGFLASLGHGPGGNNADNEIGAAKNSRLSLLSTEKTQRKQALIDEGKSIAKKIEEDAKKAIAGSIHIPIKSPF